MIYSERYNFFFFELPRTGTTSVADALVNADIGTRYPGDRHLSISEYLQEKKKFPDECKVAGSVRNPMERVLSLYVKMSHDQNGYYSRLRNRGSKTLAARRLLRHYELIRKNQWGFEEYFLAMYKWPYTDWMYHDARFCDYVLNFENLAEDYQAFMRGVGVSDPPALPKLNRTENKENVWGSCSDRVLKRAAWVFGPYLAKFGYECPGAARQRIGKMQKTCFLMVDWIYMSLRRASRTQGYRFAANASFGVGR